MAALRNIASVLILAIAAQPIAALAMPCCCTDEAVPQRSCCQRHEAKSSSPAKSWCAKHAPRTAKLQRGCCCSVERATANAPIIAATVKPSGESLFATPALLPAVFNAYPRAERQPALLFVDATPPSVNVLHCTWQI